MMGHPAYIFFSSNPVTILCSTVSYTSDIKKQRNTTSTKTYKYIKKRVCLKMIINAILLTVGLVGIPAMICGHTELTCRAAA